MVDVVATDEWTEWYDGLDATDALAVTYSVEQLEEHGVNLSFPVSSGIATSKYALRELRTQAKGCPLRTFYIFDVTREAVLLVGGDKTGDNRFYERMIRQAEKVGSSTSGSKGAKEDDHEVAQVVRHQAASIQRGGAG